MTVDRPTFACCGAVAVPPLASHTCSKPAAATPDKERPAARQAPSKPRPGAAAEDAMAAALAADGFYVQTFGSYLFHAEMGDIGQRAIVREYPWGLTLTPPRRFRSDFAHPITRTLLEIEGGAHGVQRQRRHDVLRDQLAQAAGYRIVRVLPAQVSTGEAIQALRAAMEHR